MILYLHGFRSAPLSFKARVLAGRMAALGRAGELICPQLPASPKAAMALAQTLLAPFRADQLAIVGSSLGGFYATWLAEQLGCRAVLLNPAITPWNDLAAQVGFSTNYHSDQPFEFKSAYIDELGEFRVERITQAERYFLLAASGDEVLDFRHMVAHYALARQHVIDGSDHAMADFPDYVDEVLAFCGVDAKAPR